MERLLSKSRVLVTLCVVLLMAALNRRDPMVYGMFLFLLVVSVLGFLLPWLSLRSMKLKLDGAREFDVMEGSDCDLNILVERKVPWPAFMVTLETEWEWASNRIVLTHTVPVIRGGQTHRLGQAVQFPCRGYYELISVRLSSGFPLGLIRAHHSLSRPQVHLRVLAQAQRVRWPLPWNVSEDPLGELTTRRIGQSFELGVLRPYQHGEPVGRVSWRASARSGELVIQHFQQSGSLRLRLAVDVPRPPSLGDAQSAGEQVIRLAAGVCDEASANGVQLDLYFSVMAQPLRDADDIRHALAMALPGGTDFYQLVSRIADEAGPGEQVAVVVTGACPGEQLLRSLSGISGKDCRAVVLIAVGRRTNVSEVTQAQKLQRMLEQAGFATFLEKP